MGQSQFDHRLMKGAACLIRPSPGPCLPREDAVMLEHWPGATDVARAHSDSTAPFPRPQALQGTTAVGQTIQSVSPGGQPCRWA